MGNPTQPRCRLQAHGEVAARLIEVYSLGQSGLDLLTSSSSHFDPHQTSISTLKEDILTPRLVSNRTGAPERWSIRSLERAEPQETLPA